MPQTFGRLVLLLAFFAGLSVGFLAGVVAGSFGVLADLNQTEYKPALRPAYLDNRPACGQQRPVLLLSRPIARPLASTQPAGWRERFSLNGQRLAFDAYRGIRSTASRYAHRYAVPRRYSRVA